MEITVLSKYDFVVHLNNISIQRARIQQNKALLPIRSPLYSIGIYVYQGKWVNVHFKFI